MVFRGEESGSVVLNPADFGLLRQFFRTLFNFGRRRGYPPAEPRADKEMISGKKDSNGIFTGFQLS